MAELPASVVEVASDTTRIVREALLELTEVIDVAQIGSRLHALVQPAVENPTAFLGKTLEDKSMQASLKLVAPNLEDVFVMATLGRGSDQ